MAVRDQLVEIFQSCFIFGNYYLMISGELLIVAARYLGIYILCDTLILSFLQLVHFVYALELYLYRF